MLINAPKILKHLQEIQLTSIEDEQEIENSLLSNQSLVSQITKNSKIASTKMYKGSFAGSAFEKAAWFDLVVEGADLTNVSFSESTAQRVVLRGCRLTGFKCNGSTIKDVEIVDCKSDLTEFRFARLQNVLFRECTLKGADFQNAHLKNVRFINCVVEEVQFSAVRLDNVDFRSSKLIRLNGIASMKGAIIDTTQLISLAPLMASAIGFQVRED